MHKSRYHGYIKDYDGGTVMECYIHPSIDYVSVIYYYCLPCTLSNSSSEPTRIIQSKPPSSGSPRSSRPSASSSSSVYAT